MTHADPDMPAEPVETSEPMQAPDPTPPEASRPNPIPEGSTAEALEPTAPETTPESQTPAEECFAGL